MAIAKQLSKLESALRDSALSRSEYIRVQAVLLKKQGESLERVSQITGKSIDAVKRWHAAYNKLGLNALRSHKRVSSSQAKLTLTQKEQIKHLLTEHKPPDYGYSGDFWSVSTLRQLVKDRCGISYHSEQSYYNLFDWCGFSYQKAQYVDANQRKDDASHFKKRFEKKLKKGTISMWW